jgi:hypothetical protein
VICCQTGAVNELPTDANDLPLRAGDWELDRLIGGVVRHSAELEETLLMVYIVLGLRAGRAEAIVEGRKASAKVRIKLLAAVIAEAPHAGTEIAVRVRALVEAAGPAIDDRNDAVHGVWWSDDTSSNVRWTETRSRRFTTNDLLDLQRRLLVSRFDGVAIFYDLTGTGPTSGG